MESTRKSDNNDPNASTGRAREFAILLPETTPSVSGHRAGRGQRRHAAHYHRRPARPEPALAHQVAQTEARDDRCGDGRRNHWIRGGRRADHLLSHLKEFRKDWKQDPCAT